MCVHVCICVRCSRCCRCTMNSFVRCAFSRRHIRAALLHRPSSSLIGTHSDDLADLLWLHSYSREPRGVQHRRAVYAPLTQAEPGFRHRERKVANDIYDMPIPHERTENTMPHLFPSPDQPFLSSSFPRSSDIPSHRVSLSLFPSLALVRFESIFTIQETKWQVHGVEALSFATSPKSLSYERGHRV